MEFEVKLAALLGNSNCLWICMHSLA